MAEGGMTTQVRRKSLLEVALEVQDQSILIITENMHIDY